MARPRLSEEAAKHVYEIYRKSAGQDPPDFETALATTLELASAKLEEDDWYPGRYAKKTMQMVLDDTAKRSPRTTRLASGSGNRAKFKSILNEDGKIEVPAAERRALGLDPDDLLEVTVRSFDREDDE